MSIEIGLTDQPVNTQYAPLAALLYFKLRYKNVR